jgi:hypothetical protein
VTLGKHEAHKVAKRGDCTKLLFVEDGWDNLPDLVDERNSDRRHHMVGRRELLVGDTAEIMLVRRGLSLLSQRSQLLTATDEI